MLKELWMTLLLPDSRKLKTFGQVCEFNFAIKGDKNLFFLIRTILIILTHRVPDPIYSYFHDYKGCYFPVRSFPFEYATLFVVLIIVINCVTEHTKFILEKSIRRLSVAPNGIPY